MSHDPFAEQPTSWFHRPGGLLLIAAAGIFCITFTMLCIQQDQTDSYAAMLQAETRTISAPTSGRLISIKCDPQDIVKPNDVIAVIECTELVHQIRREEEKLKAMKADYDTAQANAAMNLTWRLKQVDHELHLLQMELAELYRRQLNTRLREQALLTGQSIAELDPLPPNAIFQAAWPKDKVGRHVIELLSETTVENQREVIDTQVQLMEDRIADLETLKNKLPEEVRWAAGLELLEQDIIEQAGKIDSLNARHPQQKVLACCHGELTSLCKEPNTLITAEETIGEIVDQEQRSLLTMLPTHMAGELHLGASMLITFSGYEQEEFTGEVVHIKLPTTSPETARNAKAAVTIVPNNREWPTLPIGSAATVRLAKH
ncbi:HlyD family secretion protein [Calycomorphotria hydatis]|uniref:HlyD family secretion protein n=1 Tax=Calycomorphotria hydatis TaxID=2528027 RepID=A0A517TCQ6_9PLAN|nr:hypothetical protein [Calycomorphotria hydatis]QDT66155.1 HlyD family secretion protein [Calycomorphotria hydatis]